MRDPKEITSFLNFILSDACDQAIDYDYAYSVLADEDSEQFDLFVRLAYEFSERALTYTKAQQTRFAKMLANLAISTIEFNLANSDHDALAIEPILDAVSDASQASR